MLSPATLEGKFDDGMIEKTKEQPKGDNM